LGEQTAQGLPGLRPPVRRRHWRQIARARYTEGVASHSHTQRHRLTAQSLERMREGIRKRAEALGRDHEQRFAEVGRMVAENRIERGMSQQELAVLCGTTQSAIARLERGGRPPKLDTLMRIADALDADLLLEMRLRPRETE
jgi:ribosome-binding protein aMBF1 (putative translation factor)